MTLSQSLTDQDLLNKTEAYLKSFDQKELEEAITTLRPHAYNLYSLLSPSVITQANKHLTKNSKPEWDVTGTTSSKEFIKLHLRLGFDNLMFSVWERFLSRR